MAAYRAQNVTPAQAAHFRVEIEGVNTFQVQTCDVPEISAEQVKVSDGQKDIKFPGRTVFGDIALHRFVDAFHRDDAILQWLLRNGDPELGVIGGKYDKRDGSIIRLDGAGVEIQRWRFTGAYPSKIGGYKFDKTKSEATMEEATLSVDSCVPV